MARKFFGWTTVQFGKGGSRNVRRYRRYGNKTYLTGRYSRIKPSSTRRFQDYV